MKRKINISITATEENGAYKCHLQTGNILLMEVKKMKTEKNCY